MLPVLEAFTTNATVGTATEITLTKPSGVTFGDTIGILVGSDDNAAADRFSIAGTDWTKKFEFGNASSDCHLALFLRTADGSEAATQVVDHVTADDLWGVYFRVSGAGGEPGFTLGQETITAASLTHVADEILTAPDDTLGFYALAFDGADADFTVAGTGWSAEDTIKSGTTGNNASGTFGTKGLTGEADTVDATVTSTVSDGSVTVQFILRQATVNEWCLRVVQQVRDDISPGASGWDATAEEGSMRQLVFDAQGTVGMDPLNELGRTVRNLVLAQFSVELGTAGGSEREQEENAVPGQVNTALADTESHFQTLVDAE